MKNVRAALLLLCAVMLLTACDVSLRTHMLNENLPAALDPRTLLPVVESVTVTRASDGASVTVSGTDVEQLLMCFENIPCTRKKYDPENVQIAAFYTIEFHMSDPDNSRPPMEIVAEENGVRASCFYIGEYRYKPTIPVDLHHMAGLFSQE